MTTASTGLANTKNFLYLFLTVSIGIVIYAFALKFIWLYLLVVASFLLINKVANDSKPPNSKDKEEFSSILNKKEKFCETCGAKIDADSSFCTECGTALR